jgi:DNA-binding NarL/FixJ family response regulator
MATTEPAPRNDRDPRSRAIVVDDHPIVAEAVALAVSSMRLFDRVDMANTLADACRLLEEHSAYRLAILDLHLEDTHGRETLVSLRERFPDMPVLVFTGDTSLDNVTMSFECGARGFISKTASVPMVRSAIGVVLSGGVYIPQEATRMLGFPLASLPAVEAPAAPVRFSVRQEQVFRLLLQAMPNKVIAARLDMAEGTAKAHLNAVYRLLGVRTRVEAILKARQLGLI